MGLDWLSIKICICIWILFSWKEHQNWQREQKITNWSQFNQGKVLFESLCYVKFWYRKYLNECKTGFWPIELHILSTLVSQIMAMIQSLPLRLFCNCFIVPRFNKVEEGGYRITLRPSFHPSFRPSGLNTVKCWPTFYLVYYWWKSSHIMPNQNHAQDEDKQ